MDSSTVYYFRSWGVQKGCLNLKSTLVVKIRLQKTYMWIGLHCPVCRTTLNFSCLDFTNATFCKNMCRKNGHSCTTITFLILEKLINCSYIFGAFNRGYYRVYFSFAKNGDLKISGYIPKNPKILYIFVHYIILFLWNRSYSAI